MDHARRWASRCAAACAVVAAVAGCGGWLGTGAQGAPGTGDGKSSVAASLPVAEMEKILQADGQVSDGVLHVDMDRSDLHVSGGSPRVAFKDGFQIQHELNFEPLGHGQAILNGDVALRQREIQPVIDALLDQHLTVQAEHQHLYDLKPMVWFVHFRGTGDPLRLARAIHTVIRKTSTPLPQHSPSHPTTPLPSQRLARILGGDATVGENGVVSVTVLRTDAIRLGGVLVKPDLGISTEIQFEPLPGGRAAAVPDFSMNTSEVGPVLRTMRAAHWEVGCLYNQETGESPQLYFAHMFRTGDPVGLAREIRRGLDLTHSVRGEGAGTRPPR